jgi:hypothetical protein
VRTGAGDRPVEPVVISSIDVVRRLRADAPRDDSAFQTNPDNFCYRHPDRQSFVLCQRCLRTICPECQTPLPVGVICPECLAEQRKAASANVTRMPRRRVARTRRKPGRHLHAHGHRRASST